MQLPEVHPISDWTYPENLNAAVEYFLAKIAEDTQLAGLTENPIETIENHSGIALRFVSSAPGSCSVSGYYSRTPPTLNIHRSNSRERDNFTVVHELGHHLQETDRAWAFGVLSNLTDFQREMLQEEVSDALASRVLIPEALLSEHLGDRPITAESIAALYGASAASRQACCVAAARHVSSFDKALILLIDWDGKVSLSISTHDSIYSVPREMVQPDLKRLIREAGEGRGTAKGNAREGLVFSTSNRRYDINFEVALDSGSMWAFAVARPETRYGRPQWGTSVQQCVAPSCDNIFEVDGTILRCKCGDYKCPECNACSCESVLPLCTECWTELSIAEAGAKRITHAYHDD